MGKYLEQFCQDAWGVIQGRKKISRNKVINIGDINNYKNVNKKDYGWLAPNGIFYPVEFGKHQTWAFNFLLELYRKREISYEQICLKDNSNAGDLLTDMGWILIHNPDGYDFKITRNLSKRVTGKQKDYFKKIGKIDMIERIY